MALLKEEVTAPIVTWDIDAIFRWNTAVAAALSESNKTKRLILLCEGIKNTIGIRSAAVFVLHRHSAPICIFDEVENSKTSSDYVDFAYLLDPIYDSFLANKLPRHCLMRDTAPDGFFESDYFEKYYNQLDIQDEFYFNLPMDENTTIHITLTRVLNQNLYETSEIKLLEAMEPIISSIADDYWEDFAQPHKQRANEKKAVHNHVKKVFETFGASILTSREQEIVQLMLKGFSDKSTARILKISPGTVRNHKKNIFSKFQVTSQGQIFGLFLDTLANP